MKRTLPKPVLAVLVAVELVSAGYAWRDLARRPAESVRGSKNLWRAFIAANPGNSMAYWLLGRR